MTSDKPRRKGAPHSSLTTRHSSPRAVGAPVPPKEGAAKASGAARYIDDLTFPGMLHGTTVRSTICCGEILAVRYAFDTAGFTIADHRDIPGRNVVALIEDDQRCLAEREACPSTSSAAVRLSGS